MRRHQMLQQVRAEDRLEAATEVRQAVLDVRLGHLEAERAAERHVPLHGVDAGAARSELHQVLSVRAADVQYRLAAQIVRFTDVSDRPRRYEKIAEQPFGLV